MSREFYNEFDEWFHEIENYSFRSERFHGDLEMIPWLKAAFECGQSGPQRQLDLLAEGANMVLPRSRAHAEAMIRVGQFYLEHNKGKSNGL